MRASAHYTSRDWQRLLRIAALSGIHVSVTRIALAPGTAARWFANAAGVVTVVVRPGLAPQEAADALEEALRQSSPLAFVVLILREAAIARRSRQRHAVPRGHPVSKA